MPGWNARALLYSGRPDPTWLVESDTAEALVALATALPAADEPPRPPGNLGYRGVVLTSPEGITWLGAEGLVYPGGEDADSTRNDPERRFEGALLATAPPGLLPPDLAVRAE
jgi:hypothetical protein